MLSMRSETVGISGREMTSNVELLTHAHQVVKAKKRRKLGQVKTVVFDEDARRCTQLYFHRPARCMTL
jgi:hypothetical protein